MQNHVQKVILKRHENFHGKRPKSAGYPHAFGKRLMDLGLVILGGVLLLPLLVVLYFLVNYKLGSPAIFRQIRPGKNTKPFTIYKFRTMSNATDAGGHLLPDRERLTPFGEFLRRFSLDELPELFNVLKGDMSLVGPRPLLQEYIPYYTPREQLRHTVRPGITGWAQIHGRNLLPWAQRLELDAWYVENQSLFLDLYILICTVWKVVKREGVMADTGTVEINLNQERSRARGAATVGGNSTRVDRFSVKKVSS